MAEELQPINYVQISIQLLTKLKKQLIFDVFVKRTEGKYSKLLKKGDEVDWERINSYVEKGIEHFYITEDDYQVYNQFLDALGKKFLVNKSPDPKQATMLIRELAQASLIDIATSTDIEQEQIARAEVVVQSCISSMEKHPSMLMKIIKSMSRYDYMYRHSIMCSMFSVMLAKASGIGNETTLQNLGLGAFLHDIGTSQLNFDPETKTELTPEERKEMYKHPEIGKRMLDGVKGIRDDVLYIVMQHHEQPNGHGYPNGLRGETIFKLARIVAIADSFSSLISKRPFREAMSVQEALETMESDLGKFDKKLLRVFCALLRGKKK